MSEPQEAPSQEVSQPDEQHPVLAGLAVMFAGRLAGMSRREASALVREHGGKVVDSKAADAANLVIVGEQDAACLPTAGESPDTAGLEDLLDAATLAAARRGEVEILLETQLWQRLGLVDDHASVHCLYTPAMLADLCGVPIEIVRRWHRRGLIQPQREVRRLPYFDFQEVATARRLAELLAAGISPQRIEKQLSDLQEFLPQVERPLAQLSTIVEGKDLLLRAGEGLIDSSGQRRFDFEASEQPASEDSARDVVPGQFTLLPAEEITATTTELLEWSTTLEEQGDLAGAADMARAALATSGPTAEINFMLAELLYRMGDLTAARERYYTAIEIDQDLVEARANLGCVLAELNQTELAVAAFEGALRFHPDYPDVHYHLARTLSDLDQHENARQHWERFLELAPNSPWAADARRHLQTASS